MTNISYKNGIRFECQSSGNCCVSRDSYGYVYLSQDDIKRFAKYFSISVKDFKLKYCQTTDGYVHLAEMSSLKGKCIFLKDNRCTVYKSRPSQCRTWPFWNENMVAKIWNSDISINCPGIGKGKKIKPNIINKLLKEDYENEKSIMKHKTSQKK